LSEFITAHHHEEIAKESEKIASIQVPEMSKERLAEIRKESLREHEILKKTRTLHFTEVANLCEMIILGYIKLNVKPDLSAQTVNQIFFFLESRKIISLSKEQKKAMHESKINEGFSSVEAIFQCRNNLVIKFITENKDLNIHELLSNIELALLSNLSSNYFQNLGDEKAAFEIINCNSLIEVNEAIIKHLNIKEKRIRAKKLIKQLPKK
jgi:hypothetical protein